MCNDGKKQKKWAFSSEVFHYLALVLKYFGLEHLGFIFNLINWDLDGVTIGVAL